MALPDGDSKERPLRLIAALLEREQVSYALIGGVAVQIHTAEPRATLDLDFAVSKYSEVPADAMLRAGFEHTGRHDHSDWRAPGPGPLRQRTAVQFSAEDVGIDDAVRRAAVVDLSDGVHLRVAGVADLIVLKLAAAAASERRPSKREHDIADVLALLEDHPDVRTPEVDSQLHLIRMQLVAEGIR